MQADKLEWTNKVTILCADTMLDEAVGNVRLRRSSYLKHCDNGQCVRVQHNKSASGARAAEPTARRGPAIHAQWSSGVWQIQRPAKQ
jgi:hypothetical protein